MDFGIAVASSADSWKLVQRAEELGFTHAWFYDTQMITADPFVAMAVAAVKTSRIRLGTGVLVPSNRIAPVTANCLATLNQLAPGRIDFGIGTGFTARRAMGLGAIRLAEMAEYIRVVRELLAGQIVATEIEGKPRKMTFLNPDMGFFNLDDPIKLHISAYGLKSQSLVSELGAAWMTVVSDEAAAVAGLQAMHANWEAAGRARSELYAGLWMPGCVLAEGEPFDSPRAIAQAGPRATALLHRAADVAMQGWKDPAPVHPDIQGVVAQYLRMAESFEPADARYIENHRGHFVAVKPGERHLITADLIRRTGFTATERVFRERIEAMRAAGYSQITFPVTPGCDWALEDWGRLRNAMAAA